MQENPNAAEEFGERVRSRPASPDDTFELAALRRLAYERLYPESIVNFYKANWPPRPFTMETEGFGFRIGEFPPVQAPTLLIYGRDSGPFKPETLDGIWRWVDGPLTLRILPGVGHGPHTQVPEIVTPAIQWRGFRKSSLGASADGLPRPVDATSTTRAFAGCRVTARWRLPDILVAVGSSALPCPVAVRG